MVTSRNLLLVAHVGAAIMFLGPLTVAASLFPRHLAMSASDPAELGAARVLHRVSRAYATSSLAVPVLGLALAAQQDYLAEAWVLVSLGLFVVMSGLLFVLVVPAQRRLLDVVHGAVGAHAAEGAPFGPDLSRLRMATGLVPLVWLAILALMVLKPS